MKTKTMGIDEIENQNIKNVEHSLVLYNIIRFTERLLQSANLLVTE